MLMKILPKGKFWILLTNSRNSEIPHLIKIVDAIRVVKEPNCSPTKLVRARLLVKIIGKNSKNLNLEEKK